MTPVMSLVDVTAPLTRRKACRVSHDGTAIALLLQMNLNGDLEVLRIDVGQRKLGHENESLLHMFVC